MASLKNIGDRKFLFAIASSVGTPICTDQITNIPKFEREFGHFVRVLVDMDMRKEPKYRVLVERVGYAFFVDFDYESLPDYCFFCNCIGHAQSYCKKAKASTEHDKPDTDKPHRNVNAQIPKKAYQVVKDKRKDETTILVADEQNPNIIEPEHRTDSLHNQSQNQPIDNNRNKNWQMDNDNDSTSSKFVDATHHVDEGIDDFENPLILNQQNTPQTSKTPTLSTTQSKPSSSARTNTQERITKNMQFLQSSWPNLADQELENECNNLLQNNDTIDKDQTWNSEEELQEEPYKLVTHRKKKKVVQSVLKSTYNTKSKAVKLNLSK